MAFTCLQRGQAMPASLPSNTLISTTSTFRHNKPDEEGLLASRYIQVKIQDTQVVTHNNDIFLSAARSSRYCKHHCHQTARSQRHQPSGTTSQLKRCQSFPLCRSLFGQSKVDFLPQPFLGFKVLTAHFLWVMTEPEKTHFLAAICQLPPSPAVVTHLPTSSIDSWVESERAALSCSLSNQPVAYSAIAAAGNAL